MAKTGEEWTGLTVSPLTGALGCAYTAAGTARLAAPTWKGACLHTGERRRVGARGPNWPAS